MCLPEMHVHSEPINVTLYGNRVFQHVIMLNEVTLIIVDSKSYDWCPCQKRDIWIYRDTMDAQKGKSPFGNEGKICSDAASQGKPRISGNHQKLGGGKEGLDCFLEPSEEDFLPPE